MEKIAVIGAGSWGTALASVLALNQYHVQMWSHSSVIAEEITKFHTNNKYLPTTTLSSMITCTTSIDEAVQDTKVVLIVVPSHAMREVGRQLAPFIKEDMIVVHASKGLEMGSFKRMSEVLKEELPVCIHERIAVLSGPSHAEEVVKGNPTTVAVSIEDEALAHCIQNMFGNDSFRVYRNQDIIGVELGGSLKNIIAIGAGILDGLEFGDNAKAALLTRGLVEITRLGVKMGATPATFFGLTGMGDLIVTGTSPHSRNWKTGNLLAKGYTLDEALAELGMVAEGVKATKVAYELSKKEDIDMPIVSELFHVLFEEKDPKTAVVDLMNRTFKQEDIF